jgi:hypothetical protein
MSIWVPEIEHGLKGARFEPCFDIVQREKMLVLKLERQKLQKGVQFCELRFKGVKGTARSIGGSQIFEIPSAWQYQCRSRLNPRPLLEPFGFSKPRMPDKLQTRPTYQGLQSKNVVCVPG